MSKYARDRKLIERGMNNAPTIRARNRKAEKQFDRWWKGQLVARVDRKGKVWWGLVPVGRGLIHNGRKP